MEKRIAKSMATPSVAKHKMSAAESSLAEDTPSVLPRDFDARRDGAKMVGWYEPGQLMQTGVEVAISTIFGRHSDFRLLEAITAANDCRPFFDHSVIDDENNRREEVWIDYVADTGDGFNSTYAVFHALALDLPGDGAARTKPGNILILGGDEVYPTASRDAYKQRLLLPMYAARPQPLPGAPYVFAIPGNHDWYDSLVSFSRLFCQGRTLGGWQTDQTRSYFAIKLWQASESGPSWWMLGVDVQLDHDLDEPQRRYFEDLCREQIKDNDNIILAVAEPHWVESAMYGKRDRSINESNLAFLENVVLQKRVKVHVFIAGDLHHYRRHASPDGVHKITAGGGGAFLHPTSGPKVETIEPDFKCKCEFPSRNRSLVLGLLNLLFPFFNPLFGVVTAVLYLAIAWAARSPALRDCSATAEVSLEALRATLHHPVWVLVTVLGFVLFTDTHKPWYRWIAGSIHGVAHITAAFGLTWLAARLTPADWPFDSIGALLVAALTVTAGGWIVGSFIMGIYLLISLNICRRHSNEAFSSLAIQDYKNFVRMHIDKHGTLRIYPYKIRRVPRRWKLSGMGPSEPQVVPDDPRYTPPELIEAPIPIPLASPR